MKYLVTKNAVLQKGLDNPPIAENGQYVLHSWHANVYDTTYTMVWELKETSRPFSTGPK